MKYQYLLTLFLVMCSVGQIKAQTPAIKVFYVGDEKMKCEVGNTIKACYKVKVHKDSAWKAFPYEIEGFIWVQGVQVLMETEEYPIPDAKEGEPNLKYKFIKAIEERNMVLNQTELLAKNKWKLINIQIFRDMLPNVRRAGVYVEFNTDSNYVTGFGGCNSFHSGASFNDGSINFFRLTSTLKSCSYDSMEKKVFEVFNGPAQFYFRNNMLFISGPDMITLHFRPERRMDSLVNELQVPKISRGNHYKAMPDGKYTVVLDDEKEAGFKTFMFTSVVLTEKEKKTVLYKLTNSNPNDLIIEVQVLKGATKNKNYYKAIITFKDGSKRTVEIRNAG